MNNVELIGNLARDPELRYTTGENQMAMCRFTLAVSDGYGDKQRTSFIPIVVFGKQAENCDKFLAKGRKVGVSGRIQTGSYTNKDGNKVYTTDVIANNVEFLTPQGGQNAQQQSPQQTANAGAQGAPDLPDGFQQMQDDDIPF